MLDFWDLYTFHVCRMRDSVCSWIWFGYLIMLLCWSILTPFISNVTVINGLRMVSYCFRVAERARARALSCHAYCVTATKLSSGSSGQPHNPTRSEEGLAIARFSAPRILFSDKKVQELLRNGLSNGEFIFMLILSFRMIWLDPKRNVTEGITRHQGYRAQIEDVITACHWKTFKPFNSLGTICILNATSVLSEIVIPQIAV